MRTRIQQAALLAISNRQDQLGNEHLLKPPHGLLLWRIDRSYNVNILEKIFKRVTLLNLVQRYEPISNGTRCYNFCTACF